MNDFSHFHVDSFGVVTLFTLDRCENCNAEIQAANSVKGCEADIYKYLRSGIKEWKGILPEEGYYSDKVEGEACYYCNG